jgi:hypothetical protein
MQAKLGERTTALEECSKALSLLNDTPDNPTDAALRMTRAEAYTYVGNAYAALAVSEKVPAGEKRSHWRSARDIYQRSVDIYLDLRRRGISTHEDASDKVMGEIAKCDAALGRTE